MAAAGPMLRLFEHLLAAGWATEPGIGPIMYSKSFSIPISEFAKIPFLDSGQIGSRIVTTLCFHDSGEWKFWVPLGGKLQLLKAEPALADYFARHPERSADFHLAFLNFMTQHASWPEAIHPIDGIRNDIHNLAACLAKFELYFRESRSPNQHVDRFVSTELEYVFSVCRSIYDLLQEIVVGLWERITPLDKTLKKRQLPDSFRKMVMKNNILMSSADIEAHFRIPKQLADFYFRQGPIFKTLRDYRDAIMHRGHNVGNWCQLLKS